MKQVMEIDALVEDLSSEAMVEEKLRISVVNDQINIVVEGWESRFEVSAENLAKALATLAPRDEPPIPKGLHTMVQHIGQKLSRLEQQLAAQPQQRLDLEALTENLDTLRREVLPRLVVVETWKERIEALEKNSYEELHTSVALEKRIEALENNLAEPPAETAALSLYGGEQ